MELIYQFFIFLLCLLDMWGWYNAPILAIGIRRMRSNKFGKKEETIGQRSIPTISIVVPVKDEEKVIGRLLKALMELNYPSDKREIIIVEDASRDRTPEICKSFAEQHPTCVKFFHRSVSDGKPSALNFGFKQAQGDIVAVFDADNVPEPNVLLKVVKYFEDPSVAAVQGTTHVINAKDNMLTKLISYEEAGWKENYTQGKDALNLFVPLFGSCQFIRKDVAEKVGNWDEDSLAEDLEMSAKIISKGYNIKYASDVVSWQEAPSNLAHLIKQRMRWYRGFMEVAIKYGRLLKKLERKSFDAELTFIGPYVLILTFASYLVSIFASLLPFQPDPLFIIMTKLFSLGNTIILSLVGIALIYVTKPMRMKNLLWLPFIYAYWSLQGILATYSSLQIIFRRPKKWVKTAKTGSCTEKTLTNS